MVVGCDQSCVRWAFLILHAREFDSLERVGNVVFDYDVTLDQQLVFNQNMQVKEMKG